jgi:hypothetical protein
MSAHTPLSSAFSSIGNWWVSLARQCLKTKDNKPPFGCGKTSHYKIVII